MPQQSPWTTRATQTRTCGTQSTPWFQPPPRNTHTSLLSPLSLPSLARKQHLTWQIPQLALVPNPCNQESPVRLNSHRHRYPPHTVSIIAQWPSCRRSIGAPCTHHTHNTSSKRVLITPVLPHSNTCACLVRGLAAGEEPRPLLPT